MMTQTHRNGKPGNRIIIQVLDRRLSGEEVWRDYYDVRTHSYRPKLRKFRRNNPDTQWRAVMAEDLDDSDYRDQMTLAAMPEADLSPLPLSR
ncbi:MAG TPA: hypothetical protein VES89_00620 [Candidatus Competibacteraceae bacterium]|nr:hypothetical protein [Candidatus Competibacteraceae bacterium]